MNKKDADQKAPCAAAAIADAASVRRCSRFIVAVRWKSAKQPFNREDPAQAETINSPQVYRVTQMLD